MSKSTIYALSQWLNPKYVELFSSGQLAKLCHTQPFKHVVLDDLLLNEKYLEISLYCQTIPVELARRDGIAANSDWYWGAFSHMEAARFFYGSAYREFLNTLMDETLYAKTKSIPQYNEFQEKSKGLPVHTDEHDQVGVVTLLYLTDQSITTEGGELVFYQRNNDTAKEFRRIQPIGNKFVAFRACEDSFHSVENMQGNWKRKNLAIDWYTDVEIQTA